MRPETHNSRAKLTANGFKRTGYVFASWNTGIRGKGKRYAGGASYGFAANATLYAQWTRSRASTRCDPSVANWQARYWTRSTTGMMSGGLFRVMPMSCRIGTRYLRNSSHASWVSQMSNT